MFRRTMIILISLLAVIFLALLLRRLPHLDYGPVVELFKVEPKDIAREDAGTMPIGSGGTEVSDSDFEVRLRDPRTNRVTQVIRAEKMAPEVGTPRTYLTEPDFFIYDDDGEEMHIAAPRGYFDTLGSLSDGYEAIARGQLSGGVVIRLDRGTPGDLADDIVATMDHIDYNQTATIEDPRPGAEKSEMPVSKLYTDDPVKVRSPEGDVDALGMIIYLVRGKSDLKELRLLKDVHIVLRQQSDEFETGLTTSGDRKSAVAAGGPRPVKPAEVIVIKEQKRSDARQTGGRGEAATPRVEVRRETQVPKAVAAEKAEQKPLQDATQSLYDFYLKGNVRVRQGDRGLEADQVTLLTKDEDPLRSDDREKKRPPTRRRTERLEPRATVPPRPSPSTPTPTRPKAETLDRPATATAEQPAMPTGRTVEEEKTEQETPLPVDIVCDGPFILTPKVHSGPPIEFQIAASGEKVVLTDKDMIATGQFFSYDGSLEQGVLRADPGKMARVVQGTNIITGPHFKFDQLRKTARVDGRGQLVAEVAGQGFAGPEKKAPGRTARMGDEQPFNARWNDWMEIGFVTREVISDEDPEKPKEKQFLRLAKFTGKAVLWQGEQTLAGDRIRVDLYLPTAGGLQGIRKVTADEQVAVSRPGGGSKDLALGDLVCEHLEFDFVRLPNGKSRPDLLFASGKVRGTGEDSKGKPGEIEADKLWVRFSPDPKDPERGEPSDMTAQGDVRVRRRGLYAEADYLKTDQGGDSILLVGTAKKWALAGRGPNKVRGERILITRQTQGEMKTARADVTGPGTLDLMSNRGLSGEKIEKRTPLHIGWTESMFFDGQKNQAHFAGDTRTRTPSASIDCKDLWVFFLDVEPDPRAARKAADGDEDEDDLFGNKDLSRLTAIEKVVARTIDTPKNPVKNLQVATLRSDKLEYNAVRDKAYVPGPGTLKIIEVRRRPVATPPHRRKPVNSTEIVWRKEMIFQRSRLVAYFGEDVVATVIGRSRQWNEGNERAGQFSDLSVLMCQDLRLFFVEVEKEAGKPDEAEQDTSLKLKRLVATDRVFFKDGDYHARGGRGSYDAEDDLLVLTRSRGRPAAIWVQNEKKELFDSWGGDKLFYWLETRRIKTIGQRDITITPREKSIFDPK